MKSILALITIFICSACGNQQIKIQDQDNKSDTKITALTQDSYKTKQPHTITVSYKDADQSKLKIKAYMKCCGSSVSLKQRSDDENLYINVKEFWSPGIYVFELYNNGSKVFSFEIQAK